MSDSLSTPVEASVADRIVDAAERLYGEHGIAGVSFRQICIAAGTGNNYAVQYHFGDRDGLLRAVHARRQPANEIRRAQLLAKAKARGRPTPRDLVEALFRPIVEPVDAGGERSYARFLLALYSAPTGPDVTLDLLPTMPVARHVMELLVDALPDIPPPLLIERQRLITLLVLMSVFNRRGGGSDASAIADAFDMATAALTAVGK